MSYLSHQSTDFGKRSNINFSHLFQSAADLVILRPMPHLKANVFKLLALIVPMFIALPALAAADKVLDVTKAGAVGDGPRRINGGWR